MTKNTFTVQLILGTLLIVLVFQSSVGSCQGQESQCTSRFCLQTRGFITYYSSPFARSVWTILHPQPQTTTFLLHFKDVEVPRFLSTWMIVYETRYTNIQQYKVLRKEEQIYAFREASKVTLSVHTYPNIRFRLNFYVGCDIQEGREISVTKEAAQTQQSLSPYPPFYRSLSQQRCWLVVPTIQSYISSYNIGTANLYTPRTLNTEVQQTYMTLRDVVLGSMTSINVTDLISGETLIDAYESEDFFASTVDKSDKPMLYISNGQYDINTIILIDLQCANGEQCDATTFQFKSNAFGQNEVDCIERERKCQFNIGEGEYNCTASVPIPELALLSTTSEALRTTRCPAFNIISESIINQFSQLEDLDDIDETEAIAQRNLIVNPGLLGDIIIREEGSPKSEWKKFLRRCNKYQQYCASRRCNTRRFKRRGCQYACLLVKNVLRLCSQAMYL